MPGPAENPVARTTATTSKGMEPENEPRSCHHQLAVHTQEGTPEVRLQQKHNHAVKALERLHSRCIRARTRLRAVFSRTGWDGLQARPRIPFLECSFTSGSSRRQPAQRLGPR